MKVLVLTHLYPNKATPNYGAFVYGLMQQLVKDHEVVIITPFQINNYFKAKHKTYGKEGCEVIRPKYVSFSKMKIGPFNTGKWSAYWRRRATLRALKKQTSLPDVIYSHFLINTIPILDYAKENNIPLVVASGESTYKSFEGMTESLKNKIREGVDHIICVSKQNKEQLIELGFDGNKMTIIPNAVNYKLFKPLDKAHCKEQLGLSLKKFNVGFIGHFNHRKGPNRIIEAIQQLDDPNIQLVCVGSNGNLLANDFTKIIAPVPNHQLPEIFNSFDVFVLPTLHEGHCNVIEEAIACGVPIISSKGTSVEEQIDSSIGVLVDPLNIQEIANAIFTLKKNAETRQSMVAAMLLKTGENSINERAKKIGDLLSEVCKFAILI